MKKLVAGLLVILVTFLASCGYSQDDLIAAERRGFQAGYQAGFDESYNNGYSDGYDKGLNDAISKIGSYEDGYYDGYEEGYNDGLLNDNAEVTAPDNNWPKIEKNE